MKKLILLLSVFALLASCQTTQDDLTPEKRQEIVDQVKNSFDDQLELYRDLTMDNFNMSLDYIIESDDPAWLGNPAIMQNMLYTYKTKERIEEIFRPKPESNIKGQDYQEETAHIAVISEECALILFTGKVAYTYKDTTPTYYLPISGTYVYVLRNDEWKMLHGHQSWE